MSDKEIKTYTFIEEERDIAFDEFFDDPTNKEKENRFNKLNNRLVKLAKLTLQLTSPLMETTPEQAIKNNEELELYKLALHKCACKLYYEKKKKEKM